MSKAQLKPVLLLALSALVLRLIYLRLQLDNPFFATPALDELYHFQWAAEIARGGVIGERAFFRAPLYCYLLGLLFAVLGPESSVTFLCHTAAFVQHLGGVWACYLLYCVSRRMFEHRGIALLAMALGAVYAPALFFEGQLLDINLQAILLPLVLLYSFNALERGRRRDYLLLGLSGGVAAVARPAALPYFALFILLAPLLNARRIRSAQAEGRTPDRGPQAILEQLLKTGLLLAGLALPVLPATLHNYLAEGCFVPIASYAGVNFWIGNNSRADGFTARTPERYLFFGRYEDSVELFARRRAQEQLRRELNSAEIQSYWFEQGRREIAAAQLRWLGLLLKKFTLFCNAYEIKNNKNMYVYAQFNAVLLLLLAVFNFGLLMPFGTVGLIAASRRARPEFYLAAALLLFVLLAGVLLFFVNCRYRFPFAWMMLPFVAAGIVELIERLRALWTAGTGAARSALKSFIAGLIVLFAAFGLINHNFFRIRQAQNPAEDYWSLANRLQQLNRLEDAERYYRRALELLHAYSDAYNGLGEVCYQRRAFEQAREYFEQGLQSAGADRWARVRALNNLGATHEALREYTRAAEYYQQALELAPEHALAWANLGDVSRQLNQYSQAAAAYRNALAANPALSRALLGLAACKAQADDSDAALQLVHEFLRRAGAAGLEQLQAYPELSRVTAELRLQSPQDTTPDND